MARVQIDGRQQIPGAIQRDRRKDGTIRNPDHGRRTGIINPAHHAGACPQQLAQHARVSIACQGRVPHPGRGGNVHLNSYIRPQQSMLAGIFQDAVQRPGNRHFARSICIAAALHSGIQSAFQAAGGVKAKRPFQRFEDVMHIYLPRPAVAGKGGTATPDCSFHDGGAVPDNARRLFI